VHQKNLVTRILTLLLFLFHLLDTAWLEVDDGSKTDDEETDIAHSTLDKKTSSFFSGSLFGFASASKHVSSPYSAKRSVQQRSTGLFGSYVTNPLGWNNFGSFRLDESNSERNSSERISSTPKHEDDGFTWERSKENTAEQSLFAGLKPSSSKLINEVVNEEKNESYSEVSNVDEVESAHDNPHESEVDTQCKAKRENKTVETGQDESTLRTVAASEGRHILFIQMQLCSVQTLADFLADHEARIGSMSSSLTQANHYAVDIPFALRLFKQIANGVKYVHKQGLIHRDLKPQNCFIDEAGNVKVGDFGLSRVNTNTNAIGASNDYDSDQDGDYSTLINNEQSCAADAENTAGVGTRAYASPEQMRGSIYDASTDIYSLGIILFEMCYPMYTAMERYERFSDIRKGTFPPYWINSVKKSFPAMHDLLIRMISDSASERPSAAAVFYEIDSLLSEYSVQSLDKSWGKKGAILLRVEADDNPGILSDAMRLIKEAAPSAKILQYGLRGQASKAIMEFALDAHSAEEDIAGKITLALDANDMSVRRILAA
jgi:serine/threonine protein kinase